MASFFDNVSFRLEQLLRIESIPHSLELEIFVDERLRRYCRAAHQLLTFEAFLAVKLLCSDRENAIAIRVVDEYWMQLHFVSDQLFWELVKRDLTEARRELAIRVVLIDLLCITKD